jgi:hypothetical protein
MTKEDFKVGQTVYLLHVLNYGRQSTLEERIKEVKVLSVGRKYITVNYWGNMRFDITDNFREVTIYTPNYKLYLSKEKIFAEAKRYSMEKEVERAFRWENKIVRKMTTEDLQIILDIINKYDGGDSK